MIDVLIAARATSTRLPGKHFLDLAGMSVIAHDVERARHFGLNPWVIVPTGEADKFTPWGVPDTEILEGDPDNVETRAIEVAHELDLRVFHVIDGDDPFFDPLAVLESVNSAIQFRLSRLEPSYHSKSGSGRMGTTFNLDAPAGQTRNLLDIPTLPWPQRVTLDYPEDYALIRMIAAEVGPLAPRRAVDELFVRNPDLHKINWFRNAEWKQRQSNE